MNLTIIIPTYERQELLSNLIKYWKGTEFKILILDGSSSKWPKYGNEITSNIEYFYFEPSDEDKECPQGSYLRRLKFGYDQVATEYVLLSSDDDLFNRNSLNLCINKLKDNSSYSSCMGLPYQYIVEGNKIKLKRNYTQISTILDEIIEPNIRAITYFSEYNPRNIYAICRAEIVRKIFEVFYKHRSLEIFAWIEIFYEISMTLMGSSKVINNPYWIRGKKSKVPREKSVITIQNYICNRKGLDNISKLIFDLSNLLSNYCDHSPKTIDNYFKLCLYTYINNLPDKKDISLIQRFIEKSSYIKNKYKSKYISKRQDNFLQELNTIQIDNLFNNLECKI